MNRDFRDRLASFAAHDLQFLVVGAYAVTFHVGRPQDLEDVKALERS